MLEGSVRKAGDQVRITVQLADATTGTELWAERYDRPLRDVFTLQDEVVRKIMTTLDLQLNLAQKGIVIPRSTDNLEAYDDLLRSAQYPWNTAAGNAKAREMLEKAITLDPKYVATYAILALHYFQGWLFALNQDPQGLERGIQMAQKAIELDDSSVLAHSMLGVSNSQLGLYDQALREARRGVDLDPNMAVGHQWLAQVLSDAGLPKEGLAVSEKAVRLDPRNAPMYAWEQGLAYSLLGRWREAVPALKTFLDRWDPDNIWAHTQLAVAYFHLGDRNDSELERSKVEQAIAAAPNSANGYVATAWILTEESQYTDALAAVDKAKQLEPLNPFMPILEANVYLLVGRAQDAIPLLKTRLAERSSDLIGHVALAIAYIETSQNSAAHLEAEEIMRLDPQVSAEGASLLLWYGRSSRLTDDLRKAGLK